MNRILVCGGRRFGDIITPDHVPDMQKRREEYAFICEYLDAICNGRQWVHPADEHGNYLPNVEIISGMATGADSVAVDWAANNWCKVLEFRADWSKHGRSAGPIRNRRMLVEGKPTLVLAFPGGKGTAHMALIARRAGVETIIVPEKKSG